MCPRHLTVSLGWTSVFLRNEARDIPLHSRVLCSAHSELKQTNKKKNTKAITNLNKSQLNHQNERSGVPLPHSSALAHECCRDKFKLFTGFSALSLEIYFPILKEEVSICC